MVYTVTNFIIIWYYNICKCREFLNRRSQTSVFYSYTVYSKIISGIFESVRNKTVHTNLIFPYPNIKNMI
jgi:hypothetical protein